MAVNLTEVVNYRPVGLAIALFAVLRKITTHASFNTRSRFNDVVKENLKVDWNFFYCFFNSVKTVYFYTCL